MTSRRLSSDRLIRRAYTHAARVVIPKLRDIYWWGQRRRVSGWRRRHHNDISHEFVVIVSYGRSGSTVLQHLFNRVPGVVIRGENAGVALHLERLHTSIMTARRQRADRDSLSADSPWYGIGLVDEQALVASMRRILVRDILRPPDGTQTVGFKEIRFTSEYFDTFDALVDHLVFIDQLLPGVRFVVNVRDVQESSRSGWWVTHPDAHDVLTETRSWFEQLPAALEERLGADRCRLVDYATWSQDPNELVQMLEFCGLSLSESTVAEALATPLEHARKPPGSAHPGSSRPAPAS